MDQTSGLLLMVGLFLIAGGLIIGIGSGFFRSLYFSFKYKGRWFSSEYGQARKIVKISLDEIFYYELYDGKFSEKDIRLESRERFFFKKVLDIKRLSELEKLLSLYKEEEKIKKEEEDIEKEKAKNILLDNNIKTYYENMNKDFKEKIKHINPDTRKHDLFFKQKNKRKIKSIKKVKKIKNKKILETRLDKIE